MNNICFWPDNDNRKSGSTPRFVNSGIPLTEFQGSSYILLSSVWPGWGGGGAARGGGWGIATWSTEERFGNIIRGSYWAWDRLVSSILKRYDVRFMRKSACLYLELTYTGCLSRSIGPVRSLFLWILNTLHTARTGLKLWRISCVYIRSCVYFRGQILRARAGARAYYII